MLQDCLLSYIHALAGHKAASLGFSVNLEAMM
jgi:hypothetical protein